MDNGSTLFDALWRVSLNKSKVLKCLSICRLVVKVSGDVAGELELVGLLVLVKHLLHAFELFLLSLSEVVLVRRSSVERQRVVWILRVLLVEDVILAIVPVGERGSICTCLLNWLGRFGSLNNAGLGLLALFSSILCLVCCLQIHAMRVDNLAFFFKIESLLVVLYFGVSKLSMVILTVV